MKICLSVILSTFALLSVATADSDVLCIQKFLKKTAFDPGALDAKWGTKTEEAINLLFQQAGLKKRDQKITAYQTKEVCDILNGDRSGDILEIGKFKIFSVEIK
tara:strand:+ start:223 stop:534 length:312 start_codon:yes stop_codon:yes gene_type:complete